MSVKMWGSTPKGSMKRNMLRIITSCLTSVRHDLFSYRTPPLSFLSILLLNAFHNTMVQEADHSQENQITYFYDHAGFHCDLDCHWHVV
jgi:hypothetical protein